MSKIKDIQDRLHKDTGQYNLLSFIIARRIFLGVVSIYFTLLLFTIGGFYFWIFTTGVLSMLTFHMYSIMVVAFVWFSFSFAEYILAVHLPAAKWLPYGVLAVTSLFGIGALYTHIFL